MTYKNEQKQKLPTKHEETKHKKTAVLFPAFACFACVVTLFARFHCELFALRSPVYAVPLFGLRGQGGRTKIHQLRSIVILQSKSQVMSQPRQSDFCYERLWSTGMLSQSAKDPRFHAFSRIFTLFCFLFTPLLLFAVFAIFSTAACPRRRKRLLSPSGGLYPNC